MSKPLFLALSALAGVVTYSVLGIGAAALLQAIQGAEAHKIVSLAYYLFPGALGPLGLGVALVVAALLPQPRFKFVFLWLAGLALFWLPSVFLLMLAISGNPNR